MAGAVEDVAELLAVGQARRRTGQTAMNRESSRSHSVFCATLETATTDAAGITNILHARLNLVDLAGSCPCNECVCGIVAACRSD